MSSEVRTRKAEFGEVSAIAVAGKFVHYTGFGVDTTSDDVQAKLTSGESIKSVFGDLVKTIDLSMAGRVRMNVAKAQIEILVGGGKNAKVINLDFGKDFELRDEVFAHLRGAKMWKFSEKKLNPITASFGPLVGLAVVGGLGWLVWAVASSEEDVDTSGRRAFYKRMLVWVAELLGQTGALVVAGVLGLVMLVWLFRRVMNPPTYHVLK